MRTPTAEVKLTRQVPKDAQASEFEFLFIPVNNLGMATDPKKALRLECWRYTGERRQHLYLNTSLKYAITRQKGVDPYYFLKDVFPIMGDSGIDWLAKVHRHVDGDLYLPTYKLVAAA